MAPKADGQVHVGCWVLQVRGVEAGVQVAAGHPARCRQGENAALPQGASVGVPGDKRLDASMFITARGTYRSRAEGPR